MDEIEKAFQTVTSILLGKPLEGIRDYGPWLVRHVGGRVVEKKSRLSGQPVFVSTVGFFEALGDNIVTHDEALQLGVERKLTEPEVDSLTLENASRALSKIKTTTPEIIYGKNIGTEECTCYGPTQHCFQSTFCWFGKNNAYSYWPRTSESCYGCSQVVDCKFCMDCYSSTSLSRCFEVSDSNACSDCYFGHNLENCTECMFCFNTKGKRYAIANREIGREKYMEIKKRVLAQLHSELASTKNLKYDIYTLGAPKEAWLRLHPMA
jgi:hypothetical protein